MGKVVRFFIFRMRLCYLIMAAGFVWYLVRHYPYRQHRPTIESWYVYSFCVFLALPPPSPNLLTEPSLTALTAELLAESSPITQHAEEDRPDRGYARYEIQGQYVTLLPGKSDGVVRTIVESRDCTETYMEDGRICDDIDDDTFYVGEDGGIKQIRGYYIIIDGRIIQKGNP